MIRCIYMVEAFNRNGMLLTRQYARNKRIATKIAKHWNDKYCSVRKLHKSEWQYVDLSDVESYSV